MRDNDGNDGAHTENGREKWSGGTDIGDEAYKESSRGVHLQLG